MNSYEVRVTNTFDAEDAEDAVRQMVEWLIDNAAVTGYRVNLEGNSYTEFIDAEDLFTAPEGWDGSETLT